MASKYQSSKRHLINADINGAANIGRKELGDEWLKKLLELDGGVRDHVIRECLSAFPSGGTWN